MADVIKRTWRSGPRGVKRTSWGYTLQVPCNPCPHRGRDGAPAHPTGIRQDRIFNAAWSDEDAQKALAARILERDLPPAPAPAGPGMTFGAMVEKFIAEKKSEGKRSIKD